MTQPIPVSQNGDWRLDVALYDCTVDNPVDLTEAQALVVVQPQAGGVQATFQMGQGLVEPDGPNFVAIWIPQATVGQWTPGLWSAELRLTWPDGLAEVAAAFEFRVSAFGLAAGKGRLNVFRPSPTNLRRL